MNTSPAQNRRLALEALETRTLLAGAADPFGLIADYNQTMLAVSGTGNFSGSFTDSFGNRQLVITGDSSGAVTIDLDKLPDFITNLKVTSVGSLTVTGKDDLATVILDGVGKFTAPNLTITTGLHTSNDIRSVEIGRLAGTANLVLGADTSMELKFESMDDETTIISRVAELTLSTNDNLIQFLNDGVDGMVVYLKDYNPGLQFGVKDGLAPSSIRDYVPPPSIPNPPPVEPEPETPPPDIPGPPDVPVTPPSQPDTGSSKFVLVNLPLDERTRAFLMELRAMDGSFSPDAEEGAVASTEDRGQIAAAIADSLFEAALQRQQRGLQLHAGFSHNNDASRLETPAQAPLSLLSAEMLPDFARALSSPEALPATELPVGLLPAVTSNESAWNRTFSGTLALPTDTLSDETNEPATTDEASITDTVRAVGNYIVARVTAEFSPGQQSFVLLVDPPPPRGLAAQKRALLAQAAQPMTNPVTVSGAD